MSSSTKDEVHGSTLLDDDDTALKKTVDDTYKHIEGARVQVEQAQGGKGQRNLNRAGIWIDTAKGKMAIANDVESIVQPALQSDALKTIQEGIATFAERLPGVLKALDEVANIHPFIKVAVGAFRVVVELDLKRRGNDKKITVLFVEMRNMMEALLQLRGVRDEDTPGPDGTTIKARLRALVERTAEDIKDCANTCDTYAKKKLIVKVLLSSSWDEKFKKFLTLFGDRRKDFVFALMIHTGKAVDDVHRELNDIDAKLTTIITHLSALVPPEQERLRDAVDSRGGREAVLKDDRALVSLVRFKLSTAGSAAVKHADPSHPEREIIKDDDLVLIKAELSDSTDAAVQKNIETFERKFTVEWKRQIDAMQGIVQHESDRVIDSVLSGPHERIKDRVIYEIWKDMRWRGHVKARHFVLALRDHYLEEAEKRGARGEDRADLWALEHIDVNNVSAIAEACDDDASGFITISEVNAFTTSRPHHWSLLKWLAWWSAGWHLSLAEHMDKIDNLFEEMFALLPRIRAENHALAFRYLDMVWDGVAQLTWSLDDVDDNDELPSRFAGYVEMEEKRLDENLKTFCYKIDARDTLSLITGPVRIETVLFPLLYLLIRRHLQIFRLCQSEVVIHHEELEDCAESIMCILDAVDERGYFLERIFKQRGLSPKRQFDNFACGLFDYWFNDREKWTIKNLMIEDYEYPIKSFIPTDVVLPDPKDVLIYPTVSEDPAPHKQESLTETDLVSTGPLKDILGRWYGFFQDVDGTYPATPGMFTFFLHAVGEENFYSDTVTADSVPCAITGRISATDDGSATFASTWTFAGFPDTWTLAGVLAEDKQSIAGTWCDTPDDDINFGASFHLTRLGPEILVARPPPAHFDARRIDALWSFLRAYVHRRFQTRLSWKYIKEYVSRRKRFVDHLVEEKERNEGLDSDLDSEPDSDEEYAMATDLAQLRGTFTYEQASLCYHILDMRMRAASSINMYECAVCGDEIHGVRYTCISCSLALDESVDFCDKSECRATTAEIDETTHLPTHDVIKLRRPTLLYHDLPHLFRLAKETLKHARNTFRKSSMSTLRSGNRRSGQEAVEGKRLVPVRKRLSARHLAADAQSEAGSTGSWTDTDTGDGASRTSARSSGAKRIHSRRKRLAPDPSCVSCRREVRWPCLVCVECEDTEDIFICEDCDAKPDGVSSGRHLPTHTLVRCAPPSRSETSQTPAAVEKRLRALLDSQAVAQAKQVTALNERMSRIEGLLEALTKSREDVKVGHTEPGTLGGEPSESTASPTSAEVE